MGEEEVSTDVEAVNCVEGVELVGVEARHFAVVEVVICVEEVELVGVEAHRFAAVEVVTRVEVGIHTYEK